MAHALSPVLPDLPRRAHRGAKQEEGQGVERAQQRGRAAPGAAAAAQVIAGGSFVAQSGPGVIASRGLPHHEHSAPAPPPRRPWGRQLRVGPAGSPRRAPNKPCRAFWAQAGGTPGPRLGRWAARRSRRPAACLGGPARDHGMVFVGQKLSLGAHTGGAEARRRKAGLQAPRANDGRVNARVPENNDGRSALPARARRPEQNSSVSPQAAMPQLHFRKTGRGRRISGSRSRLIYARSSPP